MVVSDSLLTEWRRGPVAQLSGPFPVGDETRGRNFSSERYKEKEPGLFLPAR